MQFCIYNAIIGEDMYLVRATNAAKLLLLECFPYVSVDKSNYDGYNMYIIVSPMIL